jgi:hypothetical protein
VALLSGCEVEKNGAVGMVENAGVEDFYVALRIKKRFNGAFFFKGLKEELFLRALKS